MFTKIRNRTEGDQGFTLIELLVVILIIGILAAIAIPSFLSQRVKGQDACAKSMARTMQTAMETHYTDVNTYVNGNMAALTAIENQIVAANPCGTGSSATTGPQAAGACAGDNPGTTDANQYCVTVTSVSTNTFTIYRAANGSITRGCTIPAAGRPTGGCQNVAGGGTTGTW